jgi:hypothetical protein
VEEIKGWKEFWITLSALILSISGAAFAIFLAATIVKLALKYVWS